MRFGRKGKLSPRYIGPFQILRRVGNRAYELALPPSMDRIHLVFHVSMLRKYFHDESHILEPQTMEISSDLSYQEFPIVVVDRQIRKLRSKEIPVVKVLWQHHKEMEATWESEDVMRQQYPHLFSEPGNS